MRIADLPTPALLLDRGRLARNAERMRARARELSVALRVHVKTLKSIDVANLAVDAGRAIAVSTLHEARYFLDRGFDDICYAVCLAPGKLAQILELVARAPRLSVFIDSVELADRIAAAARSRGARLNVWIEVDCGEHRTGVEPHSPALLAIAKRLGEAPSVSLLGVATHAGQAYACRDAAGARIVAEVERSAVVESAQRLRQAGFECPKVSVGSTPTALNAASLEGVTEIRAGVYLAQDLFQAAVGSCAESDIALSVLATVLSRDLARNRIVIDAGGLALSKDRSTAATAHDSGYGLVLDASGVPTLGRLVVSDVHQEHGEITGTTPLPFERLPIGAQLRVLPNHACMTAAMYDRYHLVDGDSDEVVGTWPRTNGWD